MLNCREVTELCSQEMDRSLTLGERVALKTHLMMCTGCSRFREQMATMRRLMQAYGQGEGASPSAPAGDDGPDESPPR